MGKEREEKDWTPSNTTDVSGGLIGKEFGARMIGSIY